MSADGTWSYIDPAGPADATNVAAELAADLMALHPEAAALPAVLLAGADARSLHLALRHAALGALLAELPGAAEPAGPGGAP